MISTPVRRRRDALRVFLIALVLSLLVHLFGGSLYGVLAKLFNELPHHELASLQTSTDTIRLEKAQPTAPPQVVVKPKPVVHPPPPPPPVPHEVVQPKVHVLTPPHELVHITIHAPHQTPAVPGPRSKPHQYYSDEQVAQMTESFAKTIASVHQDAQSVTAQVAAAAPPVQTIKHYEMHYNGIHEGMNPGDGIISYIKRQRIGNTMWYWTHYIYMYGDGHVEEDDIPWPFHYEINDDPFARGDRRIPLQPPPKDYVPDRPLKPILEQFFGGPAVG
jgi:hypothetical protein